MTEELRYGPNTAAVERMLKRLQSATAEELRELADEWWAVNRALWETALGDAEAARDISWRTAREAAWETIPSPAWQASWEAIRGAICGVVARDLITPWGFAMLTGPWREVFGPTWKEKPKMTTTTPTTIADAQGRLLEAIATVVHQVDDLVDVVPTHVGPALEILESLATCVKAELVMSDSPRMQSIISNWLFELHQAIELLKG